METITAKEVRVQYSSQRAKKKKKGGGGGGHEISHIYPDNSSPFQFQEKLNGGKGQEIAWCGTWIFTDFKCTLLNCLESMTSGNLGY